MSASVPELRPSRGNTSRATRSSAGRSVGRAIRTAGSSAGACVSAAPCAAVGIPTPAARLGLDTMRREDVDVPNYWTLPRFEPHMAKYVRDESDNFLRPARPAGGATTQSLSVAPRRTRRLQEEDNETPPGWSVQRYAIHMTRRPTVAGNLDPRLQKQRDSALAKTIEPPTPIVATAEEVDTPYGWKVKRYSPQMMEYHTDAALGWCRLRPTRVPGAGPRRDEVEQQKDVPYGWSVPRYAVSFTADSKGVQDPAARFHGGATPSAKFAASEFVAR